MRAGPRQGSVFLMAVKAHKSCGCHLAVRAVEPGLQRSVPMMMPELLGCVSDDVTAACPFLEDDYAPSSWPRCLEDGAPRARIPLGAPVSTIFDGVGRLCPEVLRTVSCSPEFPSRVPLRGRRERRAARWPAQAALCRTQAASSTACRESSRTNRTYSPVCRPPRGPWLTLRCLLPPGGEHTLGSTTLPIRHAPSDPLPKVPQSPSGSFGELRPTLSGPSPGPRILASP